jgi:hypothetical protein
MDWLSGVFPSADDFDAHRLMWADGPDDEDLEEDEEDEDFEDAQAEWEEWWRDYLKQWDIILREAEDWWE